jgi:hypothetical protein
MRARAGYAAALRRSAQTVAWLGQQKRYCYTHAFTTAMHRAPAASGQRASTGAATPNRMQHTNVLESPCPLDGQRPKLCRTVRGGAHN